MDEVIYAPLEAGDKVGTMKISRDGQTVAEIDLITAGSVEKKGIGLIIKDFLRTIFYGGRTVAQNDSV